MIKDMIKKVIAKESMDVAESRGVFDEIMTGRATDAQIGALLVALRLKGESADELVGAIQSMTSHCVKLKTDAEPLVDTCGTGGDEKGTFNISTAAAFVAAGAGIYMAKHGNRSVSSKSGSADLLEAFGANINLPASRAAQILEQTHFTFMFAPVYHPAMKYAAGPRREIGVRTIFNILGPLVNPAGAKRQVLGIFSADFLQKIAEVFTRLFKERGFIVHSADGMDELSIFAKNHVCEINGAEYKNYDLDMSEYFDVSGTQDDLLIKDVNDSKNMVLSILDGTLKGAARDVAVANAALAIKAGKNSVSLSEAVALANESVDSGRALNVLKEFVDESKK